MKPSTAFILGAALYAFISFASAFLADVLLPATQVATIYSDVGGTKVISNQANRCRVKDSTLTGGAITVVCKL